MKKFFTGVVGIAILAAGLVSLPTVVYLCQNPSLSVAKYRHFYFARNQWMADFRTMIATVQFVWSVSHPAKFVTLAEETNEPPALPPQSTTNPVAMNTGARRVDFVGGDYRLNRLAPVSHPEVLHNAPPLSAIAWVAPSAPVAYSRSYAGQNRYEYSYSIGANSGARNGAGTIQRSGTRTNNARPHARAIAPGMSGTNVAGA